MKCLTHSRDRTVLPGHTIGHKSNKIRPEKTLTGPDSFKGKSPFVQGNHIFSLGQTDSSIIWLQHFYQNLAQPALYFSDIYRMS